MQNKHQHSAKEWDSRNCKNPSRTGHLPCHGLDLVDNRSINDLQGISNTQVDNRSMNDKVPNVTATSNGKQIFQHLPASPRPPIIHRHFQFTPEMHKLWPSHDCGLSETLGLLALLAQQIKELVLSTVLVPNSIIPPSKHGSFHSDLIWLVRLDSTRKLTGNRLCSSASHLMMYQVHPACQPHSEQRSIKNV